MNVVSSSRAVCSSWRLATSNLLPSVARSRQSFRDALRQSTSSQARFVTSCNLLRPSAYCRNDDPLSLRLPTVPRRCLKTKSRSQGKPASKDVASPNKSPATITSTVERTRKPAEPYRPTSHVSLDERIQKGEEVPPPEEEDVIDDNAPDRWKYYTEESGVPLPSGNLSEANIIRIFGSSVSHEDGNHILHILQWRRESGSLAEKGVALPDYLEVERPLVLVALEYLRDNFPMDEEAAAVEWVELAAAQLEQEMTNRGASLGLYKVDESNAPDVQGSDYGQRYGFSQLEQRQREIKAEVKEHEALEASEERQMEKEQKEQSRQLAIAKKEQELDIERADIRAYMERKEKEAELQYPTNVEMETVRSPDGREAQIPKMSFIRRTGPAIIMTALVVAGSLLYGASYTPPARDARFFPDIPPAVTTCAALVAANLLVFIGWRMPRMWKTFNRYMLLVPAWPNSFSLLGNVFSHQEFKHLLSNMLVVMLVGPILHDLIGRGDFLAVYLSSGVVGSLTGLLFLTAAKRWQYFQLGASTATFGLTAAVATLQSDALPRAWLPNLGWFDVPIPLSWLFAMFMAWEVRGAIFNNRGKIGYVTHIGGAAWGLAHAYYLKQQRQMRAVSKAAGPPPPVDRIVAASPA